MFVPQHFSCVVHRRQVWLSLFIGFLLSSFFLVSCSGLSLGGSATPTVQPTPSQVALSKLRWCNKPFIVFRDEHAPVTGTPGGSSYSYSCCHSDNGGHSWRNCYGWRYTYRDYYARDGRLSHYGDGLVPG